MCVVSPGEGGHDSVKDRSLDLASQKPPVHIAPIGAEKSFDTPHKFGISRIGI
jgi:hypothetical protein